MFWLALTITTAATILLGVWVWKLTLAIYSLAKTADQQNVINDGLAATAELHNTYLRAITGRMEVNKKPTIH